MYGYIRYYVNGRYRTYGVTIAALGFRKTKNLSGFEREDEFNGVRVSNVFCQLIGDGGFDRSVGF